MLYNLEDDEDKSTVCFPHAPLAKKLVCCGEKKKSFAVKSIMLRRFTNADALRAVFIIYYCFGLVYMPIHSNGN